MSLPHPNRQTLSLCCAIVTVRDTRTLESDRSGQLIQHRLIKRAIMDEPSRIIAHIEQLKQDNRVEVKGLQIGEGRL